MSALAIAHHSKSNSRVIMVNGQRHITPSREGCARSRLLADTLRCPITPAGDVNDHERERSLGLWALRDFSKELRDRAGVELHLSERELCPLHRRGVLLSMFVLICHTRAGLRNDLRVCSLNLQPENPQRQSTDSRPLTTPEGLTASMVLSTGFENSLNCSNARMSQTRV